MSHTSFLLILENRRKIKQKVNDKLYYLFTKYVNDFYCAPL